MTWVHLVPLVHSLGFILGGVLYAMLGLMTWRAREPHHDGGTRLALATAVLGLVWNAGALVMYGVRDLGLGEPSSAIVALAFSALGFLPGVVVHASLGPTRTRVADTLLIAAYALSGSAALLHAYAAWTGAGAPSRAGLLVLTVGFGATTLAFALLAVRRPNTSRALPAVGLAVFAVMALHLSHHTSALDAKLPHLLAHHASAPLAGVILYENYRFALADLFLKRALGVTALVATAGAVYLGVIMPITGMNAGHTVAPIHVYLIIGCWVVTSLVYPYARRAIDGFVDRVVLGRADYPQVRAKLAQRLARARDTDEVLGAVIHTLSDTFAARTVVWRSIDEPDREVVSLSGVEYRTGEEARIVVPTITSPSCVIEMRDLPPGRRLLSDDVALLEALGLMAARRIDSLRAERERYELAIRDREIQQLAAEAELRALRAQLNPHFLFNALTTLGHLMRAAPDRAVDTLYRLTALLRAMLRGSNRELTTLGEELEIVEAYLAIEHSRFEERLEVEITVPIEFRTIPIVPLLLQPLVENAVKHGIGSMVTGGKVSITGVIEQVAGGSRLRLEVRDTGPGVSTAELARDCDTGAGLGLTNTTRRLQLYYGSEASLKVHSAPEGGTIAELVLPVETPAAVLAGATGDGR